MNARMASNRIIEVINMNAFEMPRKPANFRLDERVLQALKAAAFDAGMSVNAYVENALFGTLKGAGKLPMDAQPLPEPRGGKREGAGRPKVKKEEPIDSET